MRISYPCQLYVNSTIAHRRTRSTRHSYNNVIVLAVQLLLPGMTWRNQPDKDEQGEEGLLIPTSESAVDRLYRSPVERESNTQELL